MKENQHDADENNQRVEITAREVSCVPRTHVLVVMPKWNACAGTGMARWNRHVDKLDPNSALERRIDLERRMDWRLSNLGNWNQSESGHSGSNA